MTGNLQVRVRYQDENGDESTPLIPQKTFHDAVDANQYTLWASDFGGGKTEALVMEALYQSWRYPNNEGVLGRKDKVRLMQTVGTTFFRLCDPKWIARHDKSKDIVTLINGSKIYFLGLDGSKDADEKIKGLNLGWFGIDQQEEIHQDMFWALTRRLRKKGMGRKGFATMNRAGHDWNWKVWHEKDVPKPERFCLVESNSEDNIHLPQDYVEAIDAMPDYWKKKYLGRDWDAPMGLIFPEFSMDKHQIDGKKHFPDGFPMYYQRFRTLDYGKTNPTACLWFARDPDGVMYLYDTHYQANWLIHQHADVINAKSYKFLKDGGKFQGNYGCRYLAQTDGKDGKKLADEYARHGLFWKIVYINIGLGIERMAQLIADDKFFVVNYGDQRHMPFLKEIQDWSWADLSPQMEMTSNMPERPVDKDNHAMEASYNLCAMLEKVRLPQNPAHAPMQKKLDGLYRTKPQTRSWES